MKITFNYLKNLFNILKPKPIIRGLLSYIPFIRIFFKKGTGGSNKARYCYSIWLRHLLLLYKNGINKHPEVIAEIGPGDSIGIGLASLITGAHTYYALDVNNYANKASDLTIFEELIYLFKSKSNIPDNSEFPNIRPFLKNYNYPSNLIESFENKPFDEDRIKNIRSSILDENNGNSIEIIYKAPWNQEKVIKPNSLELVYSQAVFEHIIDLPQMYRLIFNWLKPNGYLSNQIDYSAHETSIRWNGHHFYPKWIWKIIIHGRQYPINRKLHSYHIKLMKEIGFEIIKEILDADTNLYTSLLYHKNYSSKNDLIIRSAHIIAKKPR